MFTLKILYIGNCNSLAAKFVDKLVKEEHDAYIISEKDFPKETKPTLSYRFYAYKSEDLGVEKVFASVKPNVVVFASGIFIDEMWGHSKDSNSYLSQLVNVLNLSAINGTDKFIYLSSNQVYPSQNNIITESVPKKPEEYKGMLCSQGEDMVANYKANFNLDYVILRLPSIYGFSINENERDIVSNIVNKFYTTGEYVANNNRFIVPLHIKDCVEALFRAKDGTPSLIYNVAEAEITTEAALASKLNVLLGSKYIVREVDGPTIKCALDCSEVKKDFEWVQFHNLDSTLSNKEIDFTKKIDKADKPKKVSKHPTILQTIENLLLFALFVFLTIWSQGNQVFKEIDFFVIYIVLIALIFGIRQSILSVILTTVYSFIYEKGGNFNIYDILVNISIMLKIAQYLFLGVAVGYIVDHYKSIITEKDVEFAFLDTEFNEIANINNDNIDIKQEYEKRLLDIKTSLPKLHLITSQLNVLEPEKIYTGIVNVIRDVMSTNTVAVYSVNTNSQYARLVVSANSESIFSGKSINLKNYPKLYNIMLENEIFVGNQWSKDEPAFAAPILDRGKLIAIVLIKEMPFNSLTLYQTNLFRTITALISSAISIADQYDIATRASKYIENTDILTRREFEKLIQIKADEKKRGLSNFTLIKIQPTKRIQTLDFTKLLSADNYYGSGIDNKDTYVDLYHQVSDMFRDTDFFGLNEDNELIVLLGNTSKTDVDFVIERIKQRNLTANLVE